MTLRSTLPFLALMLILPVRVAHSEDASQARRDAIIVRAIERMQGYDYAPNEAISAAIERHIVRSEGTSDYLRLLKRFQPAGMEEKLEKLILSTTDDSNSVEAAKMFSETDEGPKRLRQLLRSESVADSTRVAKILGLLGNGRSTKMLSDTAADAERHYDVRSAAVTGLARNKTGEQQLLELAASNKLAADTRLLAGGLLARSREQAIRQRAAEVLPLPKQKDQKPLAPVDKLAAMKGDVANGLKLFRGVATCANCHIVNDFGREVGPNLSEIGSKLSREAMYTSILDPSAGISHNYENYIVLTDADQIINGLKMSETADEIVIRTPEAIDRKIPRDEIADIKQSEKSLMPEELHFTVDQQGLVDIVEYMTTLKKKS